MFSAVRNRRPWIAALVTLLLTPVAGMAYLNRGWLALFYLLLAMAAAALFVLVYPEASPAVLLYGLYGLGALLLAAVIHTLWLARWYDPSRRLRWYGRTWYLIALPFPLLLAAAWGLLAYAYEPYRMTSNSMTPAIFFPDRVLVSRFQARDFHPLRGDVVLYNGPSGRAVKRVVGLPGDSIQMQRGVLFINGIPVFLRFMPDVMAPCGDNPCLVRQYEELLPGGHKSPVLNRESFGTSDNTDLYLVPEDGYFMLGDDRDNSMDSRHTGPVLRRDLLGRVIARYIVEGRWTWRPVN
jgi:signal peptidase I